MIKTNGVWLVHPRTEEDYEIFAASSNCTVEQLIAGGPRIVDTIRTGDIVIHAVPCLPKDLIRTKTCIMWLNRLNEFIETRFEGRPPIGLGLWWGTATMRKGVDLAVQTFKDNLVVHGYDGTVEAIVKQVYENFKGEGEPAVAIIGGGNIGLKLYYRFFFGVIFDKYKYKELLEKGFVAKDNSELDLSLYDIGVACTTSIKDVIKLEDIPKGFIFVDDSYPHVIPEYEGRIDGGIWHDKTVTSNWLIEDGKVFGCLHELIDVIKDML